MLEEGPAASETDAAEESAPAVVAAEPAPTAADSTNPKTGVTTAFAALALSGAAVVLSKKRK